MLTALSAIPPQQSKPSEKITKNTLIFLDYVATHPDAILYFQASKMILNVHSNASYLTEQKIRNRARGGVFLSSNKENAENNCAILNVAKIMKHLISSAEETRIGSLLINTRQTIPARQAAEEMGHTKPPAPVQTINTTSLGFVTKSLNQKATK